VVHAVWWGSRPCGWTWQGRTTFAGSRAATPLRRERRQRVRGRPQRCRARHRGLRLIRHRRGRAWRMPGWPTPTVVVAPGGISEAYPSAQRDLFERAARTGVVVSELPRGEMPTRQRLPHPQWQWPGLGPVGGQVEVATASTRTRQLDPRHRNWLTRGREEPGICSVVPDPLALAPSIHILGTGRVYRAGRNQAGRCSDDRAQASVASLWESGAVSRSDPCPGGE